MPAHVDLRATGDRIEQLLGDLRASAEPRCYDQIEELARSISELYGAALGRIVELTRDRDPVLFATLAGDDLVASLLIVHGLHPRSLSERVEEARRGLEPMLAAHGGTAEIVAVDADQGVVRLVLQGSCDGCPSSAATLQAVIERAIIDAAPEVVRVEVAQPAQPAGVGVPPASASPMAVPPAPPVGVPVSLGTKPRHGVEPLLAGRPGGGRHP